MKCPFPKKCELLVIFMLLIFLSMQGNLSAQNQNPLPDTTKTKADTTLADTSKSKSESAKIDSAIAGEDLLNEKYESRPTEYDTTNKILLPLNLKKDKFAYFDASQSIDRVIPNNAFDVKEKLTFIIRYGPIKAGTAIMSIPKIVEKMGRQCYKIQTEARSSAFFSAFFKVRDKIISYMDKNGLFSWGFEKHLREGKFSSDRVVVYDQYHGWAVTNKKDSLQIPPDVHDILTSFYFIRTQKLEVGKSLFLDNHADNKLYPLEVKVHKKERIRVKAGTFDCVVVEPILRAEGLFKSKGRLLVWLTDDERKIPVQMKSKIIIGYITAELKKMEGVKKK
ncbi:MAG: DUF3108 domain-containing protein [Calditrichaeota bacterium]|nr:DUF3108 domain-containing protein [Calditrichota bacterium]